MPGTLRRRLESRWHVGHGLGLLQVMPHGHTAGEYEGPQSPPASRAGGASRAGSHASTPYAAYGGNGHFAPKPAQEPGPQAAHRAPCCLPAAWTHSGAPGSARPSMLRASPAAVRACASAARARIMGSSRCRAAWRLSLASGAGPPAVPRGAPQPTWQACRTRCSRRGSRS